jgi:hypothetical protein
MAILCIRFILEGRVLKLLFGKILLSSAKDGRQQEKRGKLCESVHSASF